MKQSALVFVAALALAACASHPPAPSDVRQIVSTTSFGMCVGYCTTRLEIAEGQAILTREARGGRGAPALPTQTFKATLTQAEWEDFARLASTTKLDGLPAVIGCPDCADGGAESLAIAQGADAPHAITFDHGAAIREAQPLLDRVRALRQRMTPQP